MNFILWIGTLLGLSLEQDFTMNDFKHRLANFSQTVSCTFTDMFVFKIFTIMTPLLSLCSLLSHFLKLNEWKAHLTNNLLHTIPIRGQLNCHQASFQKPGWILELINFTLYYSQIKFVILDTVNHTIFIMLVQCI